MWEAAGRHYGRALDFWLEAEKQTLAAMARAATPPPEPSDDVLAAAQERQRQRQAEIAASQAREPNRDNTAFEATEKPPAATTAALGEQAGNRSALI